MKLLYEKKNYSSWNGGQKSISYSKCNSTTCRIHPASSPILSGFFLLLCFDETDEKLKINVLIYVSIETNLKQSIASVQTLKLKNEA